MGSQAGCIGVDVWGRAGGGGLVLDVRRAEAVAAGEAAERGVEAEGLRQTHDLEHIVRPRVPPRGQALLQLAPPWLGTRRQRRVQHGPPDGDAGGGVAGDGARHIRLRVDVDHDGQRRPAQQRVLGGAV
eukprot:scaffold11639_cov65-Phaeocystis_antarctica.AAC.5